MNDELIKKLESIVSQLRMQISPNESISVEKLENIAKQKKIIENLEIDINNFLDLDFSYIELTENQLKIINDCKQTIIDFYKNGSIFLTEELISKTIKDNEQVKQAIKQLKIKLSEQENKVQSMTTIKSKIEIIENFLRIYKDNADEYIDKVTEIKDILMEFRGVLNYKDLFDIFNYIGTHNIEVNVARINKTEIRKPVIKENKSKMTEEQLSAIFKEYGYDLNIAKNEYYDSRKKLIKAEYIEKIITRNTEENVRKIFEFLKSINMSIILQNGEYNTSILYLLSLANADSINQILDVCSKENINIQSLIKEHPSVFKIKKEIKNKNGSSSSNNSTSIEEEGSLQDFIANIELFKSYGYETKALMVTSGCVFELPNARVKNVIERTVNVLGMYSIVIDPKTKPLASVIKSLGWVKTCVDPEYAVRRFAELGEINYVLNNPSRLNTSSTANSNLLFYRIKKAQENGDNYHLGSDRENYRYKGFITTQDKKDKQYGITEENKEEITGINKHLIFSESMEQNFTKYLAKYSGNGSTVVDNPYIKQMDEQYLGEFNLYNIGNIYISRAKTLKVFEAITNGAPGADTTRVLLYSLIFDSLLTDTEFALIKENVYNLIRGKK